MSETSMLNLAFKEQPKDNTSFYSVKKLFETVREYTGDIEGVVFCGIISKNKFNNYNIDLFNTCWYCRKDSNEGISYVELPFDGKISVQVSQSHIDATPKTRSKVELQIFNEKMFFNGEEYYNYSVLSQPSEKLIKFFEDNSKKKLPVIRKFDVTF